MTPTGSNAGWFFVACLLGAAGCLVGCGEKITRLRVVDHREEGPSAEYFQEFDECYFRRDAGGNLEIVGQHRSGGAGQVETRQVIHVKTFWTPRPGRTRVESSMLNSVVQYYIVTWPTGASFEGAGFVSFFEDPEEGTVEAVLERAALSPRRKLGPATRVFHRAELRGPLYATRDESKVVSILLEMERLFKDSELQGTGGAASGVSR